MRAVDYVDLGRYLRDVRESLNVTIEQAAVALNMRPRYLHDLEEGKLNNLPGQAYIRGYIKNYSEYLRLDSAEVLEEYEKLLGGRGAEFFVPDAALHNSTPTRWIVWVCLAGMACIYGGWYFAFYDHTAAPNPVLETPLIVPGLPVEMPDNWKTCLEGEDTGCFIKLQMSDAIPETPVSYGFIPSAPDQPAVPQPAQLLAPRPSPSAAGDE